MSKAAARFWNHWRYDPCTSSRCPHCPGRMFPTDVVAGKTRLRRKYQCEKCRRTQFRGHDRNPNRGRT